MKLDFAKNTKRNMLAGMLNKCVGLLLPFLNRTLFLWLFGQELWQIGSKYLGLNGLFLSILGVLSLAELGFGTAVVCSMHKPVADENRELLCAYPHPAECCRAPDAGETAAKTIPRER